MGKKFQAIDDALAEWIAAQHVFFVATAPLAADGHVNVSPKGLDTFRSWGRARSPTSTWPAAASRRSPTCARTAGSRSCSAPSRGRPASCGCTAGAGGSSPATRSGQRWRAASRTPASARRGPRRARTGRRLVRLRGAAVRVRRGAHAVAGLGRAQGRGGPGPYQIAEELREHRRAARAACRDASSRRDAWPCCDAAFAGSLRPAVDPFEFEVLAAEPTELGLLAAPALAARGGGGRGD